MGRPRKAPGRAQGHRRHAFAIPPGCVCGAGRRVIPYRDWSVSACAVLSAAC